MTDYDLCLQKVNTGMILPCEQPNPIFQRLSCFHCICLFLKLWKLEVTCYWLGKRTCWNKNYKSPCAVSPRKQVIIFCKIPPFTPVYVYKVIYKAHNDPQIKLARQHKQPKPCILAKVTDLHELIPG